MNGRLASHVKTELKDILAMLEDTYESAETELIRLMEDGATGEIIREENTWLGEFSVAKRIITDLIREAE